MLALALVLALVVGAAGVAQVESKDKAKKKKKKQQQGKRTDQVAYECTPRQQREDTRRAADGDDYARVRLGVCLLRQGAPDEAVRHLSAAAEAGNAEAMNNLAVCHAHGHGVASDADRALELYLAAAEGGSRDAMYNLGILFDKGRGVAVDAPQAAQWFEEATLKGHSEAEYALALLQLQGGRGVPQDLEGAARGLGHVVEREGDKLPDAQFMLGLMKLRGEGTEKDVLGGVDLIRRAADLGHNEALLQFPALHAALEEGGLSALTMGGLEQPGQPGEI